jgi:nickel superoxide dismutase
MKAFLLIFVSLFFVAFGGVYGHCQQPCGLYDDSARVSELKMDARTIRKAIVAIDEGIVDFNQQVRWIMRKEEHAEHIIRECSDYWLAQRMQVGDSERAVKLAAVHDLMVAAVKTKQSASTDSVDKLDSVLHRFDSLLNPDFHIHIDDEETIAL